ncbi:PIN domain-containing protein [Nocardia gipuzkoensis]|uniref:type II toxin-antitoxin system VapC family toxin n=1 Tax=Nocardia gipuzkoensis TaxID=2749991 RepID=UPI001E292BAB|nr:PIN domain-containing protein [Nocardia gipuzkoensis]UGT71774.1 PIN domain-containing protein [Nocardia gipuzkoensis]
MLILDTGPIVAAINKRDNRHAECARLLESAPGPLVVPAPVLTEVCYLLEQRSGTHSEALFIAALRDGDLSLEPLTSGDLRRIHELILTYADLPLGAVDASVIAVAERLGAGSVATLDVKHFLVVKPKHVAAFNLLPTR